MKYKVGDKVRVRKDLEVGKDYGNHDVVEDMKKYKGKEFIIDDTNLGSYTSSLFRYLRLNGASEIVGVIIKTPLEICIKRRPEIPEEVLKTMNGYIKTFPWSKELDKILWIKQI